MMHILTLCPIICGFSYMVQAQSQEISTKFMSGNVIFTWPSGNSSFYDVSITRDTTRDPTADRINVSQYIVNDVMLYDSISISMYYLTPTVREISSTYNVVKMKTKIGDTVNVSWTASFFPASGQYNVYHTFRENRTIISIGSSEVSYGVGTVSKKYAYLTRPFNSTNIMFEIRDITLGDAGYYNGGISSDAAWSGGGVVLIVKDKPSKPNITGNLKVEINRNITLACSSQSTSVPDYYSKLITLSFTWFVNGTKMNGETSRIISLKVTRELKHNRYSCTAIEEGLESDRSDPVQINPLYGPDRITITPEPILNINDKLTVREGETIGPFVCTADCNPPCIITWRVKKDPDRFSNASSNMGTLLQQAVQRNMQLFRCIADRGDKTLKQSIQLDVQYLDDTRLYINDEIKSNVELTENTPLRISCHVDGNPAPLIRLSKGRADTELQERQGTWLNYTIDTAQCTATDTYTCRGTSTGFNNRDKVFNISVLCNTRFDKTGSFKSTYGSKSGSDTTVNVAVPIIANPPPQTSDFTWNGPLPVSVRTYISRGDVSYKHVIESDIPVKDHNYFGNYTLSYKKQTITRITINAEDVPQTPYNFTGYSYTIGSVNLTWVSGFNGGPEQFFILSAMEGPTWKVIGNLSDPGEGRLVHFDPGPLTPGQKYSFRVLGCNRINCSLLSAKVTVKAISSQSTLANNQGVTIGASLVSFVFIVLVAVFLAMYFLKKKKIEKKRESVKVDDSRQPDVVLYASVDKSDQKRNKNNADITMNNVIVDKKDNSPAPCGEMYASVDKSLLKKKGKQPDANTNEEHENLYANSEETKPIGKPIRSQKGKRSKVKRGSKAQEEKNSGVEGEYGNVESRIINQDGLIYIDVDFSNYPGSQTTDQKPLIHGDDDRTEYTFVDFTKKATPIQETGDEEQK